MKRRYLFTRKETPLTKIAVPTLLAVFAVLFAFKTVGLGAAGAPSTPAADAAAPTPYSADHARITAGGETQEPASTF